MAELKTMKVKWCGLCCCAEKHHHEASGEETVQKNPLAGRNSLYVSYAGDVPQPLLTGHLISIVGTISPTCTRFSVNFTVDKSVKSDVAFHFNPRLEENYVVRNSQLNGKWGEEETASLHRLHLPRQGRFRIEVFIAPKEFMVSVNGKHFCTYAFRIPVTKVTALLVVGDVEIESVKTTGASQYPADLSLQDIVDLPFEEPEDSKHKLPNPFIGCLTRGLEPNWQVEVIGKIKILPHSFYINLQDGAQYWPHPEIPLHLNPRFYLDQLVVVRNAWLEGSWGSEQRAPGFQFNPGHHFHLVIRRESDQFSVWVDGQMSGIFQFRQPIKKIDTVYIQGDVILKKVWVSDKVKNILLDPHYT